MVELAAIVLPGRVMNLTDMCVVPLISEPIRDLRPVYVPTRVVNTILVVEDDADICLGYQRILASHHYKPVVATNAVAALAQCHKYDPDLIILDLGLPLIDGFELLEQFGPVYVSTVPVIVVSCRDRETHKERALKAGAVDYLQKPWWEDELLEMIDRYSAAPS
jgi:DNA-binding response OmpR family regulator